MSCQLNHNDPNDHASPEHINECYSAYEEYWDRDGRVSEQQFEERSDEERAADLVALRRNAQN